MTIVETAKNQSWRSQAIPQTLLVVILSASAALTALLIFAIDLNIFASIVTGTVIAGMSIIIASLVIEGGRKASDRAVTLIVSASFALVLFPLISIVVTVLNRGLSVFSAEFFTFSMRNVVGEGGGIYHAIIGTLLITTGAAIISIPIGLLTSIYLVEYGNGRRLARLINYLVDVMTGIPSIVAGLFAYALFSLFFGPGVRIGFGGSIALSVLMIPVVVRGSEEMLKLVPDEYREAAYALGIPKWRTIVFVVLPTALGGLVTAITLSIARVIGETAPLLVIAGATASVNFNIFDGRMASLPVFAYSQTVSPGAFPEASLERAWGAALVLIMIVLLLNLFARTVTFMVRRK